MKVNLLKGTEGLGGWVEAVEGGAGFYGEWLAVTEKTIETIPVHEQCLQLNSVSCSIWELKRNPKP